MTLGTGVARQGCSPSGSVPSVGTVNGLLVDGRQAALVIEDDEHVLEAFEVRRRLQERGLHDVVRVALDVDDLADDEALGVGRANAAAELDAGGHDLVAQGDLGARVDLGHRQGVGEVALDLAGRGTRQLADDRGLAVGQQHDRRTVRADRGHPTGERAAGCHDDIAHGDAGLGALVEGDGPPEFGRLAGDDRRRGRLELEPGPELEQAGQQLVLSAGLGEAVILGLQPIVLGAQRLVVGPQAVDVADRPPRSRPGWTRRCRGRPGWA